MALEVVRRSGYKPQYQEIQINYQLSAVDRLVRLGIRTGINQRDLITANGDVHPGEVVTREMDLGQGRFSKGNNRVILDQGERGATLIEVLDLLGQKPEDFKDCQEIHVLGTSVRRNDLSLVIVREGVSDWELKAVLKADSLPNYSIAFGSFFPTVKTS